MLTQTAIRNGPWKKARTGSVAPPAASSTQSDALAMMGAQMSFPRNAEIYGEGEAAEYIYRVVSGSVRTYKLLADGRRQVGGFFLPGDLFGLEPGDEHTFSAEAITESKVLVIKRTAVLARAERDSELAHELWALTAQELRRGQDHLMLLIKSAKERGWGLHTGLPWRGPSARRPCRKCQRQRACTSGWYPTGRLDRWF